MKNFDWSTFTKKIVVRSTLKELYDAWTKASEIEKWFLSNATYFDADKTQIDRLTSIQQGFTYEWSWYLYDVVEKGEITKTNGKDFLQFKFAGECLVDITLTQQDEQVLVELTQKNIPGDDESKRNIRLGCDSGWSFFLVNLKSVYEGGIDLREKDEHFKGKGLVNS